MASNSENVSIWWRHHVSAISQPKSASVGVWCPMSVNMPLFYRSRRCLPKHSPSLKAISITGQLLLSLLVTCGFPAQNTSFNVMTSSWEMPEAYPLNFVMILILYLFMCICVCGVCVYVLKTYTHTHHTRTRTYIHVNGLMEDCSIFIANILEILHSCTKPSMA